MARMATGDDDEALDLVQDAMLGLVKHYGTRPESEWAPLFHRILQSRVRDWYRRNRVRSRVRAWFGGEHESDSAAVLEQYAMDERPGPDDNVVARQTLSILEAALHRLPLRQQQAFLLRVWEGLDVAQTAKAMRCSQGSVKTHYFRAIHLLRDLLKDYR